MAISTVRATINGVEHSLTYNSALNRWEVTLTSPSEPLFDGYYGVSVTAVDSAANSITVNDIDATLGALLRLVVVNINLSSVYLFLVEGNIVAYFLPEKYTEMMSDEIVVAINKNQLISESILDERFVEVLVRRC